MSRKIALVTGANRGIGFAITKGLLEQGLTVILTSRKIVAGQQAADQLEGLGDLHVKTVDVSDPESVTQLRDSVLQEFGQLDVLINNAAINFDNWQTTVEADLDFVRDTMETNLLGAWRMAQAFIPSMKSTGYGRIVNVSSGLGSLAEMTGGNPAYGISKAALNALTIKLADELRGSGILVNSVCPGWVKTDMGGPSAPRTPAEGAATIIWAGLLPDDGPTGGFFRDNMPVQF